MMPRTSSLTALFTAALLGVGFPPISLFLPTPGASASTTIHVKDAATEVVFVDPAVKEIADYLPAAQGDRLDLDRLLN